MRSKVWGVIVFFLIFVTAPSSFLAESNHENRVALLGSGHFFIVFPIEQDELIKVSKEFRIVNPTSQTLTIDVADVCDCKARTPVDFDPVLRPHTQSSITLDISTQPQEGRPDFQEFIVTTSDRSAVVSKSRLHVTAKAFDRMAVFPGTDVVLKTRQGLAEPEVTSLTIVGAHQSVSLPFTVSLAGTDDSDGLSVDLRSEHGEDELYLPSELKGSVNVFVLDVSVTPSHPVGNKEVLSIGV